MSPATPPGGGQALTIRFKEAPEEGRCLVPTEAGLKKASEVVEAGRIELNILKIRKNFKALEPLWFTFFLKIFFLLFSFLFVFNLII